VTAPAAPRVSWRYTFCDLLTRRALARLPLVDADLSEVIGGPADGTGRIPLTADSVRAADPWAATLQRRTVCFAQRIVTTGDLVVAAPCLWAGIVWKRVRSGTSLTLTMSTVESYWSYRLAGDRTFTATDDATILRTVLADAEATPTGRLGITLGTSLLGTSSDRNILAADLKTVLETAQSVATTNGFEWRIQPGYDPTTGGFTLTLLIGRPLGTAAATALLWTTAPGGRPGNEVLGYELTEDGGNVPNRVIGLGSGQPPGQLRSVATSASIGPDELAAGYPLLEMALNSSTQDLTWQATLDAHTRSALAAMRAGETRITSLTVRGDRGPTTDTYGLGDTVSVNLNDPLQQTPRTLRGRVLSRKIEPVQPGRTERVAMTLGLVA
jgi:hypothetical protein